MQAKEIKPGAVLNFNDAPVLIETISVQTPSARGAATLDKFRGRNLVTKQKTDITLKGNESLGQADFDRRPVKLMYADATHMHLLDQTDYNQWSISLKDAASAQNYITDELDGMLALIYKFYASVSIERLHPLQSGLFRRKIRTTRRPGLPIESPLAFYPKRLWQILSTNARLVALAVTYLRIYRRVKGDPGRRDYVDQALTPVQEAELGRLEMFTGSEAARRAVDRRPRKAAARSTTAPSSSSARRNKGAEAFGRSSPAGRG